MVCLCYGLFGFVLPCAGGWFFELSRKAHHWRYKWRPVVRQSSAGIMCLVQNASLPPRPRPCVTRPLARPLARWRACRTGATHGIDSHSSCGWIGVANAAWFVAAHSLITTSHGAMHQFQSSHVIAANVRFAPAHLELRLRKKTRLFI